MSVFVIYVMKSNALEILVNGSLKREGFWQQIKQRGNELRF